MSWLQSNKNRKWKWNFLVFSLRLSGYRINPCMELVAGKSVQEVALCISQALSIFSSGLLSGHQCRLQYSEVHAYLLIAFLSNSSSTRHQCESVLTRISFKILGFALYFSTFTFCGSSLLTYLSSTMLKVMGSKL